MVGMQEADELRRLAGDLIRMGAVHQVDLVTARCRVAITDDLVSGPLPWLAFAGAFSVWAPPSLGEQVLVVCPEGDLAAGIVIRGAYSETFPANADTDVVHARMKDGSVIMYDPAAHALTATLVAGGTAAIVAPGGVTITGDVAITGNVVVTGQITASDDVKAGSISLKTHKHGGVQGGGAVSGGPQ